MESFGKEKLTFEDFWGCPHTFRVKPPEKARDINGYESIIYVSVYNLGLEKKHKAILYLPNTGQDKVITSILVLGLDS